MKLFKKLSLWVHNIVSRWKCSQYQNKFVDAVFFISKEAKDGERNLIIALFNRKEVQNRLTEISLMELLNIQVNHSDRK